MSYVPAGSFVSDILAKYGPAPVAPSVTPYAPPSEPWYKTRNAKIALGAAAVLGVLWYMKKKKRR